MKKIIKRCASLFIAMIMLVTLSSQTFAYSYKVVITDNRSNGSTYWDDHRHEPGYTIQDYYVGNKSTAHSYFCLEGGKRLQDVMGNTDENGNKYGTYTNKIQLNIKDTSDWKTKLESLTKTVGNENVRIVENSSAIEWLIKNMYVAGEDKTSTEYMLKHLDTLISKHAETGYTNKKASDISDKEILEIVEQFAIWSYVRNYEDYNSYDYEDATRETIGSITRNGSTISSSDADIAYAVFTALRNGAKSNSNDGMKIETENLKFNVTKESGFEINKSGTTNVMGPIKISSNLSDVVNLTKKVKVSGLTVSNIKYYNNKSCTGNAITDNGQLINKNVYVKFTTNKEIPAKTAVSFTATADYGYRLTDGEACIYNRSGRQPILQLKKKVEKIYDTKSISDKTDGDLDIALTKQITKVNHNGQQTNYDRLISIQDKGNKSTTKEYIMDKKPVYVQYGDDIYYTINVYNEGTETAFISEITDYSDYNLGAVTVDRKVGNNGQEIEGSELTVYNADGGIKNSVDAVYHVDYSGTGADLRSSSNQIQTYNRWKNVFGLSTQSIQYIVLDPNERIELKVKCKFTTNRVEEYEDIVNFAAVTGYGKFQGMEKANKEDVDIDSEMNDLSDNKIKDYPSKLKDYRNIIERENFDKGKCSYQDDDDFEIVRVGEPDLALRKFITAINGNSLEESREPTFDIRSAAALLRNGTAIYYHKKNPVSLNVGDEVLYTIRVYNEGYIDGKVKQIKDYLPEGLEFIQNDPVNAGWSVSANGRILTSNENCKTVENNDETISSVLLNAGFSGTNSGTGNSSIAAGLADKSNYTNTGVGFEPQYVASVQVKCRVTNAAKGHLVNVAEISNCEFMGASGLQDRDSTTDNVFTIRNNNITDIESYTENNIYKQLDADNDEYEGLEDDDDFEIVEVENEEFKFILNKTDENGNTLNGTKFEIEKDEEKILRESDAFNGYFEHTVSNVQKGNVYTFKVTEKSTADGYINLLENKYILFRAGLDTDGKLKLSNTNLTGGVEITAKGFVIYNNDGTIVNDTELYNKINITVNTLVNPQQILVSIKNEKEVEKTFDLALRKYITRVEDKDGNVIKSEESLRGRTPNIDTSTIAGKTTTATYKHQKDPVQVSKGDFVYYNITVFNEGEVAGHATKITDRLPQGIKFIEVVDGTNTQYSKESYDEQSNVLVLSAKNNITDLAPYNNDGRLSYTTVKIKCEVVSNEEDKIFTNIAYISGDSNEKGLEDRDSDIANYPNTTTLVTNYGDVGYIGNGENVNKVLANADEYFKGEQDDDDFEKVVITGGPEIHKGVKTVENQDSGYNDDVNEPHEWVINSNIPADIANYDKYIIADDIDYRLVYGKIKSVNIIDKNGNVLANLNEGQDKDYVLDYQNNSSDNISEILGTKYSGTLKLTFIDKDNSKNVSNSLTQNAGNLIEVKFNTTFARDSQGKLLAEIIGKDIPNGSELEYKNASKEGKALSEKPEVHTGGITLFKYTNQNGQKVGLEGAEFAIFKTQEDAKNKANALQTATSGKNGLVKFVGLQYGEDAMNDENNKTANGTYEYDSSKKSTKYWIVETKAPEGYNTITSPIEVEINNKSYEESIDVLVQDESSNRLIENKPTPVGFDLALRKYITKVEDKDGNVIKSETNLKDRIPNIDTSALANNASTATYKHKKNPVSVKKGNFVYYNLTVFNEGEVDGYAKTITDKLPQGLKFVSVVEGTKTYYEKESYDENTNTVVLKAKENIPNLEAYKNDGKLSYVTATIKCEVMSDEKDKIYTNIAWISEDSNGAGLTDRDSSPSQYPNASELVTDVKNVGYVGNEENRNKDLSNPNEYFKGEQDDDDFEKILIEGGPEIHKGVKDVKNQDSGYDENEKQEWVINSSIPSNVEDYLRYVIVDDIDYRLVYENIKSVNIIDKDGKVLAELEEGKDKDYILEYKQNSSNELSSILKNKYSGTITLTFIDNSKAVSDKLKANVGNTIEVRFNTTFAKDKNGKILAEIIGKEIPNESILEYTNASGEGKDWSETPEVHTGGITLYKYTDKNGKKVALEGAEFAIFRNEEDAKKAAKNVKDGKDNVAKKAIQVATSGKDGLVEFVGLEYGEDAINDENNKQQDGTFKYDSSKKGTKYWVVETKAPKGYKTITEPIEVEITNSTYKEEVEVLIKEEESKKSTNRLIENKPVEFDLALRKWVTQSIVIENGKETVTKTGHDAWDDPEEIVKVELHRKKLSDVTVKFRYSIRVYNQGEIEGYAKEIKDYIPEGLKFVAADNKGWKKEGDNIISTKALENKLLKPGEYADVEVVLTWINGSNNLGLKVNTAEISKDYNEWGVPDRDSTPDNRKPGEDDIDDAPVMLSVSTGTEVTYIIIGTSVLAILAGGIFFIKKYVL